MMEPTEYVPTSGPNSIFAVRVDLETGIVPIEEPATM
jgi:proline racemase